MNDNLGVQFGQTPEGLQYHRAAPSQMQRAAVVDPEAGVKQAAKHRSAEGAKHDYWSPEVRITHGQRGPLKNPRVSANPNVSEPHTVAFADYHDQSLDDHRKSLYVDYVATRPDQHGQGHARRLIEGIADAHPEHEIDFGRVMSPAVWKVKSDLESRGRQVRGRPDF